MSSTLEVTPPTIEEAVERGREYAMTLTVRNCGNEWAGYQVEMKTPYRQWGDVDPDNFALDPGESTEVALTLKVPKDAKTGDHSLTLEITNEQAPDDVTGVPITLKVRLPTWLLALIIIGIVLLLLVVLYLIPKSSSAPAPAFLLAPLLAGGGFA
jgi:uncharacterized membrane protein